MIIRTRAYPRAGLIGNPSDGYYGKTIAFCFRNFHAEVVLYQSPELEILPSNRDQSVFSSVEGLCRDVGLFGYYGGVRLLKAAIKRFAEYCSESGIQLDSRNFTIRYSSNIPHLVGLAGSSAIITAAFRAMMAFYQLDIPRSVLANLVLAVETQELHIAAGLQDRVAQAFEVPVYMDFDKSVMERQGFGLYEVIDPSQLPSLYIAYRADLSEISDVFHNNIRDRFNRGESDVVNAMKYWADLTVKARECLVSGKGKNKGKNLGKLLNANFDMRRKLYKISRENVRMVNMARSVGASAKFTGSGGAIVGTYDGERMYQRLVKALKPLHIKVIKPKFVIEKGK